ncbi:transcriptional regulator [Pedobacter lusitanus]|uniref:Transcriptional regulator n=1 Tax=Pedobacter lusitanus TaxID=1503925 RepID=A0A0D0GCI3_9SPHI|nr:response regulator transcription factor [Pedobacter lusitanus]KIO75077.1 transcriptional regulator [Pedobacter lusitanus]
MNSKILYVEDEPFIAQIVSEGLTDSGYIVKTVADGKLVIKEFEQFRPDICVMDIMLPTVDGYSLTAEIRKIDVHVPIIFVSAKSLTEDVVRGFKTGGNDYLKKPFSMDELLVRIESLLSRFNSLSGFGTNEEDGIYEFANCRFDAAHQQLITPLSTYLLSYKEAALLELLLNRKNNVLERQEVLLKIWKDDTYYNTRSLDVFMAHLRKLLRDDPDVQIMSLRGVGYKLFC